MKYNEIYLKYKRELKNFEKQRNQVKRLWNISNETAHFIYFEFLIAKCKNILEIGTSNGFSTFWLSLAAQENSGSIQTIEFDKNRHNMARKNLENRTNITFYNDRAENIFPILPENYFDAIFIDANKKDYLSYINLLDSKMKNNCLIIADNVISHSETTNSYLKYVKNCPKFISTTLSIGAGLEMSYFKKDV